MASTPAQEFVGFGFGPIQSGLFLYEAYASGLFSKLTVGEVDRALVAAVRGNGGKYHINIAHPEGIQTATVPGVELLDINDPADRCRLVQAATSAGVLATALPSVAFYDRGGGGGAASVVGILAEAIPQRAPQQPAIIYTAENNNHAAEILQATLAAQISAPQLAQVQALNTVIGKMSGVTTDPAEIARLKLTPLAPGIQKAVLVEAFNRILISQITLPEFAKSGGGIPAFVQKQNLLPFEEAKLYGHNAIHSLIGYMAHEQGLTTMDQAAAHPRIMALARQAFLEESGAALCRKYQSLQDPLFTASGFSEYAEDLLTRIVNPYLCDPVARVIRDPQRKLSMDDRLFGTMRLVMSQGITPRALAQGAAAGVRYLLTTTGKTVAGPKDLEAVLLPLWQLPTPTPETTKLVELTWSAMAG